MIRNRVKELRTVRAGDLVPHPDNWRLHPEKQRRALSAALAEIGYADALLARELPDGQLGLIDGHLRAETTPDQEVPVLVLDLTDEEARKLLLTLDPMAGLAEIDGRAFELLLNEVVFNEDALCQMLKELAEQKGIISPDFQPVGIEEQGRLDEKAKVKCPECGHEFTP